jgi:cobalt-zinc-cadmium efflux system membrane fusion protein
MNKTTQFCPRLSFIGINTILMSILVLSPSVYGQHNHDDHEGHDHGEETSHIEALPEHEEHDGHAHSGEDDHGDHDDDHGSAKPGDHEEEDHEELTVSVASEVLNEFGIELDVAGPGTLHEEVVLPGEIQFNREELAYATPRFPGTVTSIKARLSDAVRKGQVLATMESTETLRPFEVVAPFDGTIVDYDITQGTTVEAGISLFTVANLSTVWADLRIYQRDLNKIHSGQRVVVVNGHEGPTYTGTISYISPTIDEHTRTGLARVIVDNRNGEWRPGQFVKGSVSIEEHPVPVLIPRTAVLTHEGKTVVFVQTDEGFTLRPVLLGHSDATHYEVESGLRPGEIFVTRNAISLKAEMNKGSFGGHAGHVH